MRNVNREREVRNEAPVARILRLCDGMELGVHGNIPRVFKLHCLEMSPRSQLKNGVA